MIPPIVLLPFLMHRRLHDPAGRLLPFPLNHRQSAKQHWHRVPIQTSRPNPKRMNAHAEPPPQEPDSPHTAAHANPPHTTSAIAQPAPPPHSRRSPLSPLPLP